MRDSVQAWYLEGMDYKEAPTSLAALRTQAQHTVASCAELMSIEKWEHLLQGKRGELPDGWVFLEELVATMRGIATGANGFFLISKSEAARVGIRSSQVWPCVGRANDVRHIVFTGRDFDELTATGGKTELLNLHDPLTEAERAYVARGEEDGLLARYLLKMRFPWYSMEQRNVAPIWAAVFGRGDLKFVFNEAGVRSLTNFHCVYPHNRDPQFMRALVFCLNSSVVRAHSKLHTRIYGGGLSKFEPKDVKAIPVPDLRRVSSDRLAELGRGLDAMDRASRLGNPAETSRWDELVEAVGREAAKSGGVFQRL
jgi:hypothetical protein